MRAYPTTLTITKPIDKWDHKSIAVLAHDETAYDLADHLADVLPETICGRSIWDMSTMALALLAPQYYPGGAPGLQYAIAGGD